MWKPYVTWDWQEEFQTPCGKAGPEEEKEGERGQASATAAKASRRASRSPQRSQRDPDRWHRAVRLICHRHSFHLQSKDLLIGSNLKSAPLAFKVLLQEAPAILSNFILAGALQPTPQPYHPPGILVRAPHPAPSFKS